MMVIFVLLIYVLFFIPTLSSIFCFDVFLLYPNDSY